MRKLFGVVRQGSWQIRILILLSILIALTRLRTYSEPLERDLTTYAVIANEMLAGRALYSDLWDHKPPAIHLSYLASVALAGCGPAALYILGISTAILTLFGVFAAGTALEDPYAGLWAAVLVPATALILLLLSAITWYWRKAEDWSQRKYGDIFKETSNLGRKLDGMLEPGETFYQWGGETGLYFASRRRPPTGVIYALPLLTGPLAVDLTHRVLKDLDRTSPEVFIAVKGYLYSEVNSHPVIQWFSKHYRPFADTEQGSFLLFIRRGGRLDSLFSAQGGRS